MIWPRGVSITWLPHFTCAFPPEVSTGINPNSEEILASLCSPIWLVLS